MPEGKENVLNQVVAEAVKGYESCLKYKKNRLEQIKLSYDEYNNQVGPALRGRFNVPVPVVSGFVETLLSKIDDKPSLVFERKKESTLKIAKKVTSAWEIDSAEEESDWSEEDTHSKKNAIFEGVGIYNKWSSSNPDFRDHIESITLFDFIFDPHGGNDLEKHLFVGQDNIDKTKEDLEDESYDKEQVKKLLETSASDDYKNGTGDYTNKVKKYDPFGSEPDYSSGMYRLCQMGVVYKGQRYYVLFDYRSGIWIRGGLWKDIVSKQNLWSYVAFHTHPRRDKFLTKAPLDDVLPVAEATRILFNQSLDNLEKRNWDMKAFDADLIDDPRLLEWDRSDKLVPVNASRKGKNLSDAVYQFTTPDSTMITIRLMDFLSSYWGKQTGITPDAQGASDEKRVGILVSNIQQVADRLGYTNKQYVRAWKKLGLRYLHGLKENMSQRRLIKVIGAKGAEWEELLKKDVETNLDIVVRGGRAELEADELNQKRRTDAIVAVAGNQLLLSTMNPSWVVEQMLRAGQFEDEDIKLAFDKNTYGDRELLSEAAMAIEEILQGNTPKINRGATDAFMQKILDFATNTDVDEEVFNILIQYAQAHSIIAAENMNRKAQNMIMEQQMNQFASGDVSKLPDRISEPRIPHSPNIPGIGEMAGVSA